jgi:hypothetical protein
MGQGMLKRWKLAGMVHHRQEAWTRLGGKVSSEVRARYWLSRGMSCTLLFTRERSYLLQLILELNPNTSAQGVAFFENSRNT